MGLQEALNKNWGSVQGSVQNCLWDLHTLHGLFWPQEHTPFFQQMMAYEFAPVVQKYEPYLSNYLDEWIVTILEGEEVIQLHHYIMHNFLNLMEKSCSTS